MPQPRSNTLTIRTDPAKPWTAAVLQGLTTSVGRAGTWFVDTAQQFGSLLSALMGPAVLSTYAFAAWSLATNLGWTDTFPFGTGPLSNWMIWAGIAISVHVSANVLRRHTSPEK